jgi:hypothetical protein
MQFEGDKGWIDAGFGHCKASDDSLFHRHAHPTYRGETRCFVARVDSVKPAKQGSWWKSPGNVRRAG